MSAAILANKGVLKYLSPVSGSMATITDPSGAFFAVSTLFQNEIEILNGMSQNRVLLRITHE